MRARPRDLAQALTVAQQYFLQATGDTAGLGGSFQDVPGLAQGISVLKGQIVLMQASVAVWAGGNDTQVFWTLLSVTGTSWPAGQWTGACNSGHQTVSVLARYVAVRDEFITVKIQACTPSGGGGQVLGGSARSNALIQVLNPTP